MPHVSVLEVVKQHAERLLTNDEEWEKRMKSIEALKELVETKAEEGKTGEFTTDVFRVLVEPFRLQLRDLRSSITRETCRMVSAYAQCLGDQFSFVAKKVLPVLIDLSAVGNKVIIGHAQECSRMVLRHCRFHQSIPIVCEQLVSKSKDIREQCFKLLLVILENYPTLSMDRHVDMLEKSITAGVADASEHARVTSRRCFIMFRTHWADRGERMYSALGSRTQRSIEAEDYDPSEVKEGTADVYSTPAVGKTGGGGGGASTAPKSRAKKGLFSGTPRGGASSKRPGTAPSGAGASATSARASHEEETASRPTTMSPRSSRASPRSARYAAETEKAKDLAVGDRVDVLATKGATEVRSGVVRFVGQTDFALGEWVGVDLERPVGRNNGTVEGFRYFECPDKHGLFVRPSQVERSAGDPEPEEWEPEPAIIDDAVMLSRSPAKAASARSTPLKAATSATPVRGSTASRSTTPKGASSSRKDRSRSPRAAAAGGKPRAVAPPPVPPVTATLREATEGKTNGLPAGDEPVEAKIETNADAAIYGPDVLKAHRISINETLDALRLEMDTQAMHEEEFTARPTVRRVHKYLAMVRRSVERRRALLDNMMAQVEGFEARLGPLPARKAKHSRKWK